MCFLICLCSILLAPNSDMLIELQKYTDAVKFIHCEMLVNLRKQLNKDHILHEA